MPRFQKKHHVSVRDALKQGLIERYYVQGWKRYFYATQSRNGFVTGNAALDYYFEQKEQEQIRTHLSKYQSAKDVFPNCFVASRDGDYANYWNGSENGWQVLPLQQFRQKLFAIEERCGFGIIWVEPQYLQLLKSNNALAAVNQ